MKIIRSFYQYAFTCLLCILLSACELDKSIVDENYLKRQESSDSQGSLNDGIWFKNMAVGTNFFAAKPNEETELMVMQGALFTRSDDTELTAAQLKRVNFSLTGANKDLFSLVKKTFTKENANNFPAGEQTVLVFNKDMAFFFDEVKKRCRICSVTLKAELDNGTQATAEISLKLLEVNAFGLKSINTLTVDEVSDEQNKYTFTVNALVKEGELNHLYLISTYVIKEEDRPNDSSFQNIDKDLTGDGKINKDDWQKAADLAYWYSAIPTAKELRQVKYIVQPASIDSETGKDYSADSQLLNISVVNADLNWFLSIDRFKMYRHFKISNLFANGEGALEAAKEKQANKLLPIVTFNAPSLKPNERTLKTCNISSVKNISYYISNRPYKVNVVIISTESDAPILKMAVNLYVVGSEDERFKLIYYGHYPNYPNYFEICNEKSWGIPTPSIELLPPLTNSTD